MKKKKCPNRDEVLAVAAKKLAALQAENAELMAAHDKMARRMAKLERELREARDAVEELEWKVAVTGRLAKRMAAERDDEKTKARVLSSFAHHLADELGGRGDG